MLAEGFRQRLIDLGLNSLQVENVVLAADRFQEYLDQPEMVPSEETAWTYSRLMIAEARNTEANYRALIHYCRFIKEYEMMVAFLELVDGGEVGDRLYRLLGERFGEEIRDEAFAGIGVAPYGTPSPQKPAYLQPVIRRLEERLGTSMCREFLSASLRDLPEDDFAAERERLRAAGDIDSYLRMRKAAFLSELETCFQRGRLFYAQEITPEVLDFVRGDPEMGGGRREGDIIYETKLPYMTAKYLAESDPTLRRFFACHCPWARHAILRGDVQPAETFCQCSGGFHKKPLEVALGRKLEVDVLESVLKGDVRCRFAIHLNQDGPKRRLTL